MKVHLLTYLLLITSLQLSIAQKWSFKQHEIGRFGSRMGQTSLRDMDKDGDLDYIFGQRGKLHWYECRFDGTWILHPIGEGATTDVGGCAHDVNQDGWTDFIIGDSWYENTGSPFIPFLLHKKNMISSHDNVVADIDGDGIKDVVSVSNDVNHPVLAWYKIPLDYRQNWDYHRIGKGIHGGISPKGYADLDQDGDLDIVCGDRYYINIDGKGSKWTAKELVPHGGNRPDKYGLALKSWCIDLDRDGWIDIVQAEADTRDARIYWWKNIPEIDSFTFHLVSAEHTDQDFHSLAVADFDGDGDADIASGGGPLSQGIQRLVIWENTSEDGKSWQPHIVLQGYEIHEMVAGDIDADGDIDIVSKPWTGNLHIYLENMSTE
ncbi:MAG: VCBS repeat-containing protein [Saprospiraceae bacterium]|nr:VCBS repeat-containing protein [Saprospiraceae bacterium]